MNICENNFLLKLIPIILAIKKNRNTVFIHSKLGLLVKKISSVNYTDKSFYVNGNNNLSIQSKMLGKINFSQIEGFPILHIKKFY